MVRSPLLARPFPTTPASLISLRVWVLATILVAVVAYPASPVFAAARTTKTARPTRPTRPTAKTTKKTTAKTTKTGSRARAASRVTSRAQQARIRAVAARKAALALPLAGNVVVFPFKGDGTGAVHGEVVQVLRARGLTVSTDIRPLDSAQQYRDMATTLGLVAYVHGEVVDRGDRARVTVKVRSGYTGKSVASARFLAERDKVSADVGKGLWVAVGGAFARACAATAKPRRLERAPMRIEAGTPIESTPVATEGT